MKRYFLLLLIFLISFLASVFVFGAAYYKFGVSIEQIIFLLSFPMAGLDDAVSKTLFIESVLYVVLPSFAIALVITFLPNILSLLLQNRYSKSIFDELKRRSIAFRFCVAICFLIVSISILENKFKIFANIHNYLFKEYSTFYEENYIAPNITKPKKARNLIVIFAESMESTYSSKTIPANMKNKQKEYAPFGELIPNLSKFATRVGGINFSNTDALGGLFPNPGSSVTIAGLISYTCGVPLYLPRGGIHSRKGYFSNIECVGNILHTYGYNQVIIQGADSSFSEHKSFFKNQNIAMQDVVYYKTIGVLPKDYSQNWGMEDSKVFANAKDFLINYKDSKPFALYISTLDTHFPDGYIDKNICKDLSLGYDNAIKCSDRIIGDFIHWAQKQRFYTDTTIIVLGDHLSMQQNFFPKDSKRAIFDVFINAKFSKTPTKDKIKNRSLSHFDITTLILDSIGFKVESFGLGRNPLYQKTLLEQYGVEEFNDYITQPSRVYDSFWKQ